MTYKDHETLLAYKRRWYEKNKTRLRTKAQRWRDVNREKIRKYSREYYKKNIEKLRQSNKNSMKRQRLKNPQKFRDIQKNRYYQDISQSRKILRDRFHRLRRNLMLLLGGIECNDCGFNDYQTLHFDHIHGGGRKELQKMGNTSMYYYYLRNPELAKQKLQVLCANCNSKKRYTNNEIFKKR